MADLHHQIPIQVAPENVFAAIATQSGMRSWWTADTQMEERIGGQAEFGFERRQIVFRMTIEKLDPSKQVVMTCCGDHPEWNGTRLTWTLTHDNGVTTVRFNHSGWKAATEFYATCNSTWGELMYRLKDTLEGKHPGPHWRH
jgi:uncharacterized protein YndB with AHSA1/START domain